MANYQPHNWQTGEVIAESLLDTLENAVANAISIDEQTWTDAQQQQVRENIGAANADTVEEIIATKANIDGYYEQLTAGTAEQLISTITDNDKVPYNFRTTGGSVDVENRVDESMIVGMSVVWNQLNKNEKSTSTGGTITYTKGENGIWTLTGNASGTNRKVISGSSGTQNFTGNHIYYMSHGANIDGSDSTFYVCLSRSGTDLQYVTSKYGGILKATSATYAYKDEFSIRTFSGLQLGEDSLVLRPVLVDLTQMFGEAIANYFLTLETATAGEGAKAFRALFPNIPSTYDSGTLMSVQASKKIVTGFNQWDEKTETGLYNASGKAWGDTYLRNKNLFRVIPEETYHVTKPAGVTMYMYGYADTNYANGISVTLPSTGLITIPNGVHYIGFAVSKSQYGNTYNNDICINLSWDGSRDGEYEPYKKYEYALDDELELRGIPKVDSNGNLYADGDVYKADGTVIRRYGIVDLGTLTWSFHQQGYFYATVTGIKQTANYDSKISLVCPVYENETPSHVYYESYGKDKIMSGHPSGTYVLIRNSSYETTESFKTAMSGVYLVYELATPTTESADAYTKNQVVDDWGTEEFVDAGVTASTPTRAIAIPVGHDSKYMANLRDKLQHLPSLAESDGTFLINQSGTDMSLTPFLTDTTLSVSGNIADAKATGDAIAKKANAEGESDLLTAGSAEQLISSKYIEDKIPYVYRQSPNVGTRLKEQLVGMTICWNQLCRNGNFANGTENWSIVDATASAENGVATIAPTNSTSTMRSVFSRILSHKHLIMCQMKGNGDGGIAIWGGSLVSQAVSLDNTWKTVATIVENSSTDSSYRFDYTCRNNSELANWQLKNCVNFDLTQMFGSTIADYIYSLETATAGAGVAWFCKLFPMSYYAYNTGTLMNTQATKKIVTGFNIWDEEWELGSYNTSNGNKYTRADAIRCKNLISVQPNTTYYLGCVSHSTPGDGVWLWYDKDKNFISPHITNKLNRTVVSPSDAAYMTFYIAPETAYRHDICFNISGSRDGEYEPHVKYEYAFDSDLTLRGIPKLDGDNNLYSEGDLYYADGSVIRKYGIVDLGTLTWVSGGTNVFAATLSGLKVGTSGKSPLFCDKYTVGNITNVNSTVDKTIWQYYNTSNIRVYDTAYNDTEAFKTAMSGVYLIYELASPTTESAKPYTEIQNVDPYGTEEFIEPEDRGVVIPVGHNSKYMIDLRKKIEQLSDIPEAPTTNGTYTLHVTVNNGALTYSWVSVT